MKIQKTTDQYKECFVIMPFSATNHATSNGTVQITETQWDHIYKNWIKRAVESYPEEQLQCKRSPSQPGNFVRGIVEDLAQADLVIADLTGNKSNVYYELGIRHALQIGTVIITQDLNSLPSDLKSYHAFEYEYSELAHKYEEFYSRFEKELHSKISSFQHGKVSSDSPVSDFLGFRTHIFEKKAILEKRELGLILDSFRTSILHNFDTCSHLLTIFEKGEEPDNDTDIIPILDTFPLEVVYHRLYGHQWEIIPQDFIASMGKIISDYRKYFLSADQMYQMLRMRPTPDLIESFIELLQSLVVNMREQFNEGWSDIIKSLGELMISLHFEDENGNPKEVASRKIP